MVSIGPSPNLSLEKSEKAHEIMQDYDMQLMQQDMKQFQMALKPRYPPHGTSLFREASDFMDNQSSENATNYSDMRKGSPLIIYQFLIPYRGSS